jgi:hypothetical protein
LIDFIVVPERFIPKEALADLLRRMGGTWHDDKSFGQYGSHESYFDVDWYPELPPTFDSDDRASIAARLRGSAQNVISIHTRQVPSDDVPVGRFINGLIQRWGGYYEPD